MIYIVGNTGCYNSYGMAIVLGLICRLESLELDACFELEEAIDELWRLWGSRFSVWEKIKTDFSENAQKLEKCRKVSEMYVIDLYSDFVKSFHIQRGQNGHLINDWNRGRGKICLKAYNHHCP